MWDLEPPLACLADVLRVHEWSYLNRIRTICESLPALPTALGRLDADTAVSRWSYQAALRAAGAACKAVDAVVSGKVSSGENHQLEEQNKDVTATIDGAISQSTLQHEFSPTGCFTR